MAKVLNMFYAKNVIAPVLDDTQNFLKKVCFQHIWHRRHYYSLNAMTNFSFWTGFGQKWRFPFSKILLLLPTSLKILGYRKWKQMSKRKRYLSALQGASPSLKNWGSPFVYSPEKLKASSSVLVSDPFLPPPKKCQMF